MKNHHKLMKNGTSLLDDPFSDQFVGFERDTSAAKRGGAFAPDQSAAKRDELFKAAERQDSSDACASAGFGSNVGDRLDLTSGFAAPATADGLLAFDDTIAGSFEYSESSVLDSFSSSVQSSAFLAATPVALTADIPDDKNTTATLAVDQTVSSDIGATTDQDWFKITLEAGKTYRFHLDGDWNGQTGLAPQLRLMDDKEYYFSWGNGKDTGDGIVEFTPQVSGDYFLVAKSYKGMSAGTYTLSAQYIETKPVYTIEQIADHIRTLGGQLDPASGQRIRRITIPASTRRFPTAWQASQPIPTGRIWREKRSPPGARFAGSNLWNRTPIRS